MDQYISKTEIEDEVKRHLNIANTGISYAQSGINYGLEEYKSDLTTWTQCQYTCRNILAFLDTLEVKEMNSTDAVIEKACKYISCHQCEYIDFDDFKKYMKGE